jgi:hypothetical protein
MRPALALPLLALTSCAPNPVVGDWTCATGSADWTNELSIFEDLSGTVTLHYAQEGTTFHSVLDAVTQDRGGGLYWIDLACTEDCPAAGMAFRMTCELSEDAENLDCEATGWYDLAWVRAG